MKERLASSIRLWGILKNKTIQKLYAAHLTDLHFWQAGKPTPAFWGVAKLQALQLGITTDKDKMLTDPSAQTKVKTLYGKPESKEALKKNVQALNLIGWVACQGSKKPEFPATDIDPNPLPLPTDRTCDDLKPEDAVPGLEALTNWVSQQKK